MFLYRKDVLMTVTQAAEFLGCTKDQVKQLVQEKKLTPFKAFPNDIRYLLSMREVNKFHSKRRFHS